MTQALVVIGTDTNVGKTVFAAALADALGAHYWKPVQAGLTPQTDSQTVAHLGGLSPDRIALEAWRLPTPASPHIAARAAGVKINVEALHPPQDVPHVIIETAGGVMVPLTEDFLTIDLLARWRLPAILVARTELGTINHSLLTLEALRQRDIAVLGVAFVGDEDAAVQQTIATIGGTRQLG
jgi:dethiobiotin synthetase